LKACYPQGLVEAENETALLNTVQSLLTSPLEPLPVTIFQLSQMTEQTIALYAEMVRLK